MPNQNITNYLRENKDKFPKETLISELRKVGYGEGEIEESFDFLDSKEHSKKRKNIFDKLSVSHFKKFKLEALYFITGLVILIGVIFYNEMTFPYKFIWIDAILILALSAWAFGFYAKKVNDDLVRYGLLLIMAAIAFLIISIPFFTEYSLSFTVSKLSHDFYSSTALQEEVDFLKNSECYKESEDDDPYSLYCVIKVAAWDKHDKDFCYVLSNIYNRAICLEQVAIAAGDVGICDEAKDGYGDKRKWSCYASIYKREAFVKIDGEYCKKRNTLPTYGILDNSYCLETVDKLDELINNTIIPESTSSDFLAESMNFTCCKSGECRGGVLPSHQMYAEMHACSFRFVKEVYDRQGESAALALCKSAFYSNQDPSKCSYNYCNYSYDFCISEVRDGFSRL